jgi:hypothetical protein
LLYILNVHELLSIDDRLKKKNWTNMNSRNIYHTLISGGFPVNKITYWVAAQNP